MWIVLAFISALCLGFYDVSKKVALRDNKVVDVLTISVCVSALILSVPLILSRLTPEIMQDSYFFVPRLDREAHLFTLLKSVIVLSSWVFGYISIKHLPISVVSPLQATRPMWTLVGALLIFGERLNAWQWVGVLLAIGTVFLFSFKGKSPVTGNPSPITSNPSPITRYYIALAMAILIGACSGLYDKYLMRRYDHNAVQVYYTIYQAVLMLIVWTIENLRHSKLSTGRLLSTLNYQLSRFCLQNNRSSESEIRTIKNIKIIILISLFLIVSDNVYMLALRDPDSMIAVVSTVRRGGAVIGFAYGLLFLRESDPWRKIACMLGILLGLICLAFGSM